MNTHTYQPLPGIAFYLHVKEVEKPVAEIFSTAKKASPAGPERLRLNMLPVIMTSPDGSKKTINTEIVSEQLPKDKGGKISKMPKSLIALEIDHKNNPHAPVKLIEFIFRTLMMAFHRKGIGNNSRWKIVIDMIESDADLKEKISATLFDEKKMSACRYAKLLKGALISERVVAKHLSDNYGKTKTPKRIETAANDERAGTANTSDQCDKTYAIPSPPMVVHDNLPSEAIIGQEKYHRMDDKKITSTDIPSDSQGVGETATTEPSKPRKTGTRLKCRVQHIVKNTAQD